MKVSGHQKANQVSQLKLEKTWEHKEGNKQEEFMVGCVEWATEPQDYVTEWVTLENLLAHAGSLEHHTLDWASRQLSNVSREGDSTMPRTNSMQSLDTLEDLPRFTF